MWTTADVGLHLSAGSSAISTAANSAISTAANSAVNIVDPHSLLQSFGVLGVLVVLFAETGLLVGFFLPGDTLLFAAGFFASQHNAPLGVLMLLCPIVTIAGAQVGHLIGVKSGPHLLNRPDGRLFRRQYVVKAQHYFEKFGPARAVVLCRFIPVARTFLNPVAGMLGMSARRFFVWNVVGGVLWTELVLLLGFFLGRKVPSIDRYILPIVAIAVIGSMIPVAIELVRGSRRATAAPDSPAPSAPDDGVRDSADGGTAPARADEDVAG